MKKIFVDLEMQPVTKQSARKLCRNEIIEIGAIALDETLSETSSYKTYVKPEFSRGISHSITDLTGITTNTLTAAVSFEKAVNDFARWCVRTNDKFQIYAWSDTDKAQIEEEMSGKNITPSEELRTVLNAWNNFQQEFDRLMGSKRLISLSHALEISGIAFEGKMHDALWDARNTAHLYKAVSDPEQYQEMLRAMRFYKDDQDGAVTIGDLFDFGALLKTVS